MKGLSLCQSLARIWLAKKQRRPAEADLADVQDFCCRPFTSQAYSSSDHISPHLPARFLCNKSKRFTKSKRFLRPVRYLVRSNVSSVPHSHLYFLPALCSHLLSDTQKFIILPYTYISSYVYFKSAGVRAFKRIT